MQLLSALFSFNPQNVPLKNSLVFFLKKPALKFLYFLNKSFSNFQEMELSYLFLKNVFLTYISGKVYSEPWHIQNQNHIQKPGIFRTRDIFRILYSEYSSAMEHFAEIATQRTFKPKRKIKLKKKKKHSEKISYIFSKKAFLILQETELSCISGNETCLYLGKWKP